MSQKPNQARRAQVTKGSRKVLETGTRLPLSKKAFTAVSVIAVLAGFGAGILCDRFLLPSPSASKSPSAGSAAAGEDAWAGMVAATIGDTEIMESEVTQYIEVNMRVDSSTGETMSDADWVSYLESNSWTPESLREAVIRNVYALPLVIVNAAEESGIAVDEASVQTQLEEQKESAGADGWDQWLADNGYRDEAAYVVQLKATDVYEELMAANVDAADPTADEIDAYVSENAASYAGKRLSGIYLPYGTDGGDDAEAARVKADAALTRIRAGEDFAAVADEYNSSGTMDAGGDMGWGVAETLSEECVAALETMTVGDVSDVIDTGSAFFVLKVTDDYALPSSGTVDLSLVPANLREKMAADLTDSTTSQAESAYYDALVQSDLVTINPMPEGLPYYVAMG